MYNKAKKTRNQDDWQELCDIRKNVHKQLRSARVSHTSQFLTTSITDKPKSFWTFISKLRQDNQGIGDLHVSGSIVSDDVLKADALNEQFNSVYTEEVWNDRNGDKGRHWPTGAIRAGKGDSDTILSSAQHWPIQVPVAGTGRRLGRDVDPTSRLGSIQTSEWYFRVARRRRSEGRRRNEPRPA